MEAKEILMYYHIKYNGDWDKIFNAVKNRETLTEEETERYTEKAAEIRSKGVRFWTPVGGDIRFSEPVEDCLKKMIQPPFVLEVFGDPDLVNARMVATDDDTVRDALVKAGFTTIRCTVRDVDDEKLEIITPTGELVYIKESSNTERNCRRAVQLCHKVLLGWGGGVQTQELIKVMATGELLPENVYAIPRHVGAETNKLIKMGVAKFCDSTSDLLDTEEK